MRAGRKAVEHIGERGGRIGAAFFAPITRPNNMRIGVAKSLHTICIYMHSKEK